MLKTRQKESQRSTMKADCSGESGGRDRARTGDPLLAKQVLSQLSYTPTTISNIILRYLLRFQHRVLNIIPMIAAWCSDGASVRRTIIESEPVFKDTDRSFRAAVLRALLRHIERSDPVT